MKSPFPRRARSGRRSARGTPATSCGRPRSSPPVAELAACRRRPSRTPAAPVVAAQVWASPVATATTSSTPRRERAARAACACRRRSGRDRCGPSTTGCVRAHQAGVSAAGAHLRDRVRRARRRHARVGVVAGAVDVAPVRRRAVGVAATLQRPLASQNPGSRRSCTARARCSESRPGRCSRLASNSASTPAAAAQRRADQNAPPTCNRPGPTDSGDLLAGSRAAAGPPRTARRRWRSARCRARACRRRPASATLPSPSADRRGRRSARARRRGAPRTTPR